METQEKTTNMLAQERTLLASERTFSASFATFFLLIAFALRTLRTIGK